MDRNQLSPLTEAEKELIWQQEKAAIEAHKFMLSKEMGRDCGWFYAYWSWNSGARDKWMKEKGLM